MAELRFSTFLRPEKFYFYAKNKAYRKNPVGLKAYVDIYFALYRNVTIWPLEQFSLTPNLPFSGPDVKPVVIFFW